MVSLYSRKLMYTIKFSASTDGDPSNISKSKINGASTLTSTVSFDQAHSPLVSMAAQHPSVMAVANKPIYKESRLHIPTKKQLVDPFRHGHIEGGVGYRQTVVVRSYEVGADKTATLETILNLLQVF